jgi:predicted ABC-type ATPase
VALHVVALDDPARLLDRVAQRVREGGHPVPPERILARYPRTLALLAQAVRRADVAYLYDAADTQAGEPRLVALRTPQEVTELAAPLPLWVQAMLFPARRQIQAKSVSSAYPESASSYQN